MGIKRELARARIVLWFALPLLIAGCNGGSSGSSVPAAQIQFAAIAGCTVDAQDDVVVGGNSHPPGCTDVDMEPGIAEHFDEVRVEKGGVLLVTAQAQPQTAHVAQAGAQAFAELEPPLRMICVYPGGTVKFERGTAGQPITDKDKLVLTFVGTPNDIDTDPNSPCQGFSKGIDVAAGGSLLMYGAKGVPARGGVSWTTLSQPAGPMTAGAAASSTGPTTLDLTADVTKGQGPWQPGDWIVVATTSYTPFESEFVQIATVTSNPNGGSTVTLKEPLKYYHYGSLPPSTGTCPDPFYPALSSTSTQPAFLCDGADRNYGVDERAEVGLISRDIELTSDTRDGAGSEHWGGEIIIHAGFKQVAIQGVRISKFGKAQLGSYPIHFHMVGDITKGQSVLIDSDSVDHSFNKCVTIHETSNLTISNLVCARIVGHIFYEELGSANDDNVADDSGIVFDHDLGIGAMSNSFNINGPLVDNKGKTWTRQQLIDKYWWAGDYMTNAECSAYNTCIDYDGFDIPDTDNTQQAVHGSCEAFDGNGGFTGQSDPPCAAPKVYIEPASGFWIQNPGTVLENDAIAGCQGVGRGFWWVAPGPVITVNGKKEDLKFFPVGTFKDNRASACYSGFYDENEYSVHSDQLFPHQNGTQSSPSIVATFDGMTATRNRFRGVWMRPVWFVIKDGHFASNRENVTLVTSGGIDGNAPGVWELLKDSVLIGFSENNVERWGPCPTPGQLGPNTGGLFGCIDHTPTPSGKVPDSGDEMGQGYEQPYWNDFGYMLYDGPVRIFHDRFVNFNYNRNWTTQTSCSDPSATFYRELDSADCAFLKNWEDTSKSPTGEGPPTPYEGDAALGWFQSNQSAYPTGTVSKQLMWVNTDLRHQIYTELVGVNTNFNDGDKNTAIIDEDGTLSGMGVQLAPGAGTLQVHPISLNNLPFNGTSNSVDECLSRGGQNQAFEGRDTSLMSPASMGTLEFSDLYPFLKGGGTNLADYPGDTNTHWQNVTFTRDDEVPNGGGGHFRPSMTLQTGRNGLGIWEPKVANGYGYTVTVAKTTSPSAPPSQNSGKAGIWQWIDVGLADIVDPNISPSHPFFVRLGIDYTDANGNHPPNAGYFTITRGYKSYVGGNIWQGDPELLKYWTPLACNNLDALNPANIPWSGDGFQGNCPSGPTTALSAATSIGALTNSDGSPNLSKFYYDAATGYLYLNVVQQEPNPVGPSPTGSCTDAYDGGTADPSCPDTAAGETYYACPKEGCVIYAIAVTSDSNYTYVPGPSTGQPAAADLAPPPARQNKLLNITVNPATVIAPVLATDDQGVPYYTAANGPVCTVTQSQ